MTKRKVAASPIKSYLPWADIQGLNPQQSAFQRSHPALRKQILSLKFDQGHEDYASFLNIHNAQSQVDTMRARQGRPSPYKHPGGPQPWYNPMDDTMQMGRISASPNSKPIFDAEMGGPSGKLQKLMDNMTEVDPDPHLSPLYGDAKWHKDHESLVSGRHGFQGGYEPELDEGGGISYHRGGAWTNNLGKRVPVAHVIKPVLGLNRDKMTPSDPDQELQYFAVSSIPGDEGQIYRTLHDAATRPSSLGNRWNHPGRGRSPRSLSEGFMNNQNSKKTVAAVVPGDPQHGLGTGHTAPGVGNPTFDDPENYLPQVYEHPEYYASPLDRRDPLVHRSGMESHRALLAARGNPDALVKIYRAVPHGITEIEGNTNPAGASWVSPSPAYARRHADAESCPSCGGDMQVISGVARAGELHNEGYLEEWGYSGDPIRDDSALTECPEGAYEARKEAERRWLDRQASVETPDTGNSDFDWEEAPPGRGHPQDRPWAPDPARKTGVIESEEVANWQPLGKMQDAQGRNYDVRWGIGNRGYYFGQAVDPDVDHTGKDRDNDHEAVIKWSPYGDGEIAWRGSASSHRGGFLSMLLKHHLMENLPADIDRPHHSTNLTGAGRASLEAYYDQYGDPHGDIEPALNPEPDYYDDDDDREDDEDEDDNDEPEDDEKLSHGDRSALEDHGFTEDNIGEWNKEFTHPKTGDTIEEHNITPDGRLTVRTRGLNGERVINDQAGQRRGYVSDLLETSRNGFANRNLPSFGWTPHYKDPALDAWNSGDSGVNQPPLDEPGRSTRHSLPYKWTKVTQAKGDAPYVSTITMPDAAAYKLNMGRIGHDDGLWDEDGDPGNILNNEARWAGGYHTGGRHDFRLNHAEFHKAVQDHFGRPALSANGTHHGSRQSSTPEDHAGRFGMVDNGWLSAEDPDSRDPSKSSTPVLGYDWDSGQYKAHTPFGTKTMPGRQMTLFSHGSAEMHRTAAAVRAMFDEDNEHLRQVFGVDPYNGGQLGGPKEVHPKSGWPIDVGLHRRLHIPTREEGEVPAELSVDDHGTLDDLFPKRDVAREPIAHVYRAMSASEVNQALKEGFIHSDQRGTIAPWEGTNAGLSPATARSYVSRSEPSVIAKIRVQPEDEWFAIPHDDYVRTRKPIPIDRIEAISKAYHYAPDPESRYDGKVLMREASAAIPDESGIKAAGIAVIAMDTGRVLMQQRALNPMMCPCGQGVTWDEGNGYQHEDGSVSHDGDEFYGQSVSDLLDQGHIEKEAAHAERSDDLDWSGMYNDHKVYYRNDLPKLYHGTSVQFSPGDYIEPGHKHNFPGAYQGDYYMNYVHATPALDNAWMYADNAYHEQPTGAGQKRHVYEVEPTGYTMQGDETHPEDFESDEDMFQQGQHMSESPFKVVREVPYNGERLPFTENRGEKPYPSIHRGNDSDQAGLDKTGEYVEHPASDKRQRVWMDPHIVRFHDTDYQMPADSSQGQPMADIRNDHGAWSGEMTPGAESEEVEWNVGNNPIRNVPFCEACYLGGLGYYSENQHADLGHQARIRRGVQDGWIRPHDFKTGEGLTHTSALEFEIEGIDKTAMPRDEEFLSGLTYHHTRGNNSDAIDALDTEGNRVGGIGWHGGTITGVDTDEKHQNKGLATELLGRARDINGDRNGGWVEHDWGNMSPSATVWAERMGESDPYDEDYDGEGFDKTAALEYDPNEGTWEFPGGKLDEGESPRAAAMREFREEVGQDLPPGVFVGAWVSPGGIVVSASALEGPPAQHQRDLAALGWKRVDPHSWNLDDPQTGTRHSADWDDGTWHLTSSAPEGWGVPQEWHQLHPQAARDTEDEYRYQESEHDSPEALHGQAKVNSASFGGLGEGSVKSLDPKSHPMIGEFNRFVDYTPDPSHEPMHRLNMVVVEADYHTSPEQSDVDWLTNEGSKFGWREYKGLGGGSHFYERHLPDGTMHAMVWHPLSGKWGGEAFDPEGGSVFGGNVPTFSSAMEAHAGISGMYGSGSSERSREVNRANKVQESNQGYDPRSTVEHVTPDFAVKHDMFQRLNAAGDLPQRNQPNPPEEHLKALTESGWRMRHPEQSRALPDFTKLSPSTGITHQLSWGRQGGPGWIYDATVPDTNDVGGHRLINETDPKRTMMGKGSVPVSGPAEANKTYKSYERSWLMGSPHGEDGVVHHFDPEAEKELMWQRSPQAYERTREGNPLLDEGRDGVVYQGFDPEAHEYEEFREDPRGGFEKLNSVEKTAVYQPSFGDVMDFHSLGWSQIDPESSHQWEKKTNGFLHEAVYDQDEKSPTGYSWRVNSLGDNQLIGDMDSYHLTPQDVENHTRQTEKSWYKNSLGEGEFAAPMSKTRPLMIPSEDDRNESWGEDSTRDRVRGAKPLDIREMSDSHPHSPMNQSRLSAKKKSPVYKGFIYLIQSERDIDLGNREIANPDDPDGDMSEQSAWWDIEHARKNPALRKEVKQTPWAELELWADKSVRNNKQIKEAVSKLAMGLTKRDQDSLAFPHDHEKPVYVRFGDWPTNERSINYITGHREEGVSVYELNKQGMPVDPDSAMNRGYADWDDEGNPVGERDEDYFDDTQDMLRGHLADARRGYNSKPDRRAHLVTGELVGFGHGDEPVLNDLERVGHWPCDVHKFIPGLKPSRANWCDNQDHEDDMPHEGSTKMAAGKTEKCMYCKEPSTQEIVHSEGMARIPVCGAHLGKGKTDAANCTPDGSHDKSNIDSIKSTAASKRPPGTSPPAQRVFPLIRDVITAGRPEYSLRAPDEVDVRHHDLISDSDRPVYHQEKNADPRTPRIYAIRNQSAKDYTFLAPVTHNETGEDGWLRGRAGGDPSTWRLYHDTDDGVKQAIVGKHPDKADKIPADQRYIRQRATGKPPLEEGDVPLDEEGHQLVEPRRDTWSELGATRGFADEPWWVVS